MDENPCLWTHQHGPHDVPTLVEHPDEPRVLYAGAIVRCHGKDKNGNELLTLLEDPDGAPYPEPVQEFVRALVKELDDDAAVRLGLVEALESVSKFEFEQAQPQCRLGNVLQYHTGPCAPGCQYPSPSLGEAMGHPGGHYG